AEGAGWRRNEEEVTTRDILTSRSCVTATCLLEFPGTSGQRLELPNIPHGLQSTAASQDAHTARRERTKKRIRRHGRFGRGHTARLNAPVEDHLRDDRRRGARIDVDADPPRRHPGHMTVEDVFDARSPAPAARNARGSVASSE